MMDGSKDRPNVTAGLDLGDKYSYLCLIETESGEVIEEGRLARPQRPSGDASPPSSLIRIAMRWEPIRPGRAGCSRGVVTRSWWPTPARRGSSMPTNAKPTSLMPKILLAWRVWIRNYSTRSSTGVKWARLTWPSSAPGRRWSLSHPAR